MSRDKKLILCDNQAVAGISTTVYSDFTLDLGAGGNKGLNPMSVVAKVSTAYDTGSGTVQAILQDSADDSSYANVLAGKAIATSALTAKGAKLINFPLPPDLRRYVRLAFVIATAAVASGKIEAHLEVAPETAL